MKNINISGHAFEDLSVLSDDALIAKADDAIGRYSYYLAGWDYPESARRDREAELRARDHFERVKAEMHRRGLHATKQGLVSIKPQEATR